MKCGLHAPPANCYNGALTCPVPTPVHPSITSQTERMNSRRTAAKHYIPCIPQPTGPHQKIVSSVNKQLQPEGYNTTGMKLQPQCLGLVPIDNSAPGLHLSQQLCTCSNNHECILQCTKQTMLMQNWVPCVIILGDMHQTARHECPPMQLFPTAPQFTPACYMLAGIHAQQRLNLKPWCGG